MLDDLAADRQAQAGALRAVARIAAWRNFSKPAAAAGRNAGAVVLHLDRAAARAAQRTWTRTLPGRHELGAFDSRLSSTCSSRSRSASRHAGCSGSSSAHAGAALAEEPRRWSAPPARPARAGRRSCAIAVARLDLGHVQHLVDQAGQALGLGDDDAEELLALLGVHLRGRRASARPKARIEVSGVRSSCVTEDMKSSFSRSRLLLLVGGATRVQLAGGLLQRASASTEASSSRMSSSRPSGLLLHHRGHHDARAEALPIAPASWSRRNAPARRRPQRVDTPRARARTRRTGAARAAPRKRARRARQQIGDAGRPRQNTGSAPALRSEHVDEQRRLAGLGRRVGLRQSDTDVAADVDQQAPEQQMRG